MTPLPMPDAYSRKAGPRPSNWKVGVNIARVIKAIVNVDIPVMGHIGLTPQSVHRMGGYKVQGKKSGRQPGARERLIEDAGSRHQRRARFAVVLEGVPMDLAAEITDMLPIPTIGIGAGPHCDGQILGDA